MDYATLMESVTTMNDEQLLLAEKKIHEERRKRAVTELGYQPKSPSSVDVLIDFAPLINAVREKWRRDMSIASDAVLASVLDQIKIGSEEAGQEMAIAELNEEIVIKLLTTGVAAALVHEVRCETARRLDSVA
jgi:hypothetical protein